MVDETSLFIFHMADLRRCGGNNDLDADEPCLSHAVREIKRDCKLFLRVALDLSFYKCFVHFDSSNVSSRQKQFKRYQPQIQDIKLLHSHHAGSNVRG